MKFGVSLVPHDLKETAASARLAEDLGFDYIGIPDSQSLWRELYLSLSVVAGATSKVGIGPTVTNALTRHPAVAASAIATLNEMSGGRAYFGIGSGDSAILNLGLRPARLKEMQEYIEAMRAILSGQSYEYKGREIHVQWSENPVPIIMSAEGPKTLALAGGIADAVIVHSGLNKEVLVDQLPKLEKVNGLLVVRRARQRCGRSPSATLPTGGKMPLTRLRWPWRLPGTTPLGSRWRARTFRSISRRQSWPCRASMCHRSTSNWATPAMRPSVMN